MATHVIDVSLAKKSVHVSPDQLEMETSDVVTWRVDGSGRVRIEFEGASPFESTSLDHAKATGANRPRDEAKKGPYKYSIIDEADALNRLDPVIIIKTPPTSGHDGP